MDMTLSKLRKLVTDREAWCACYSPWGHEESDTTERLNWTELPWTKVITYNAIYSLKNTYYYFALNNLRNSCHTEPNWSIFGDRISYFKIWWVESPLDCKEIQPDHPKVNWSWVFIGRTDVKAETPVFWPLDAKSWLIWKDPDVGKDWRQEEKRMTEDEMVGWHHRLNGHEFG